jgi:hypothetical protein
MPGCIVLHGRLGGCTDSRAPLADALHEFVAVGTDYSPSFKKIFERDRQGTASSTAHCSRALDRQPKKLFPKLPCCPCQACRAHAPQEIPTNGMACPERAIGTVQPRSPSTTQFPNSTINH